MNKINYDFKNRTAIVTGGAQGFGLDISKRFLDSGGKVIIWDIDQKMIEKASNQLNSPNLSSNIVDVSNYNEVEKSVSEITKNTNIDILINNAGNNIPEHFTKVKTRNMEYLVKVNTIATFNIAQLCALKMIKSKNRKKIGGAIINMSSQMGHVGGPIRSVYNMTKFGLEGLTKGMSIDLAKYNIRVNTICPTFVVTPMTSKFFKSKKFKREVLSNIPLGRFAELSEVASSAVFLASDASSMITGTSLLVDGGWTAR